MPSKRFQLRSSIGILLKTLRRTLPSERAPRLTCPCNRESKAVRNPRHPAFGSLNGSMRQWQPVATSLGRGPVPTADDDNEHRVLHPRSRARAPYTSCPERFDLPEAFPGEQGSERFFFARWFEVMRRTSLDAWFPLGRETNGRGMR